jgi:hypothetical protein
MTQNEYRFLLIKSIGFEPTEIKISNEGSYKRISIKQNVNFHIFNSNMFENFAYGNIITFSIIGPNLLYITFRTNLINE